ncbi:MAG: cytochrome bd-I oxidase subunit CydX [Pseudomonadota bacterium]|nr:cytochrome bd-I oxidase subunit CydX [Pseudomonadota bacterium]
MWYFSWALGVSFAVSFAIINAMWLEEHAPPDGESADSAGEIGRAGGG